MIISKLIWEIVWESTILAINKGLLIELKNLDFIIENHLE